MVHQAQAKNQIKVVPKKHAHPDNYIQILSLRVFAHHFLLIALNKQIVTEKTMHAQTDIQTVKGWGMTGAEQKKRTCQIFQHFTTRGSKNIRNCFIGNVPSLTNFYLS